MAISDQKPGVIGVISNLGQSAKQGVQKELKKTVENSLEQLTGKERKEMAPDPAAAAQAEALRKKQSQETVDWLYGTSTPAESPQQAPIALEKKPEGKGDMKQQLGLEQKKGNAATGLEHIGVKKDTPNNLQINPFEQIMGKSALKSATATEQLDFTPAPTKTPEEQQQLAKQKQELHNKYYQGLTAPKKPETEERMEEAREEQETAQQRMERLKQEDLQEEQKKKEKQKPLDTEPNIEKKPRSFRIML